MTTTTAEKTYWQTAADDPDVDIKYIADVDTDECLLHMAPVGKALHDSNAKILDLGCGVGRLAIPLAQHFIDYSVVGVDISPKMVAIANKRFKATRRKFAGDFINNFEALVNDGRTIPQPDKTFAGAYSMLLFQHLDPETVQGYIKEVARVLKYGVFRLQFVEGEYHHQLDHNHTTKEMTQYLKAAGFTVGEVNNGLVHPQWTWITAVKI